jgi:uncharacterized protein YggE
LVLLAGPAPGQTSLANRPFIRAAGEGVVSIHPDQMRINIGVTTQAASAQEAGDRNATRVAAVLEALRQLLGPNADLKTINYSVSPNYRYPTGGGQPEITGYTASNIIEVTSADLSLAGRVIDAAVGAGANNITGLRFGLKDPDPARREALRLATQQARSHAEAIAQGLNARLGAVLAASEGFTTRLASNFDERGGATTAATTPIETGNLEVRAQVTIEYEIAQ